MEHFLICAGKVLHDVHMIDTRLFGFVDGLACLLTFTCFLETSNREKVESSSLLVPYKLSLSTRQSS